MLTLRQMHSKNCLLKIFLKISPNDFLDFEIKDSPHLDGANFPLNEIVKKSPHRKS